MEDTTKRQAVQSDTRAKLAVKWLAKAVILGALAAYVVFVLWLVFLVIGPLVGHPPTWIFAALWLVLWVSFIDGLILNSN